MKKTYAGNIKNTGSQKVDALFVTKKKSKSVVKKGQDLRSGTAKK